MAEPSSSIGGYVAWKIGAALVLSGTLATALGFLMLWPKTLKEAFIRFTCAILGSALVGPVLIVAMYAWKPSFFGAGIAFATLIGLPGWAGIFTVGTPLLVLGGLPFWYLLGWWMRWLERNKDKDLVEVVADNRRIFGGSK